MKWEKKNKEKRKKQLNADLASQTQTNMRADIRREFAFRALATWGTCWTIVLLLAHDANLILTPPRTRAAVLSGKRPFFLDVHTRAHTRCTRVGRHHSRSHALFTRTCFVVSPYYFSLICTPLSVYGGSSLFLQVPRTLTEVRRCY